MKIILLFVLLGFACLLGGTYGALQNQISYSVSPEYFHEFKFHQFGISPEWRNRFGASYVGWMASWWMGLIIGLPIYLIGLFIPDPAEFSRVYIRTAGVVVAVTFLVGIVALAVSFLTITDASSLPSWSRGVSDPIAFARAGTMHNFSYLGGLIGLLIGSGLMIRSAIHSRRAVNR